MIYIYTVADLTKTFSYAGHFNSGKTVEHGVHGTSATNLNYKTVTST